jgi:hypothetical protein
MDFIFNEEEWIARINRSIRREDLRSTVHPSKGRGTIAYSRKVVTRGECNSENIIRPAGGIISLIFIRPSQKQLSQ